MERLYQDEEVTIRLRGLESSESVRIHLEHVSGAALIVPSCVPVTQAGQASFQLTGFDGIRYSLVLEGTGTSLVITATGPSPLLGGASQKTIPRGPDPEAQNRGIRVTGDESTMPIPVED